MDLKTRISTPLEAGTSLLDAHKLPSYLGPAFEFISQRLAMKGLHVTLVVARRNYQLPSLAARNDVIAPTYVPVTNLLPSPPTSPTSPDDVACGPSFTTIKSLVRSRSQRDKADIRSLSRPSSKKPSLASLLEGPRPRRTATSAATSYVPRTPATPASSVTTSSSHASSAAAGLTEPREPEIRLIHTTPLNHRAYKLVTATLARATRKFNLTTPLTVHEPATYNIPPLVLHSSILQNETLHSSEGLTLLSLDHLYTFKAALNQYAAVRSEFGSHFRLEDAVDELRRYVLSAGGGRRRLLKSTLASAYDWLGPVNETALGDVMRMYSRAYGGATETGVEDDLVKVNHIPALAASMALAKIVDESAQAGVVEPLPGSRPQSASKVTVKTVQTPIPIASPPASLHSQSGDAATPAVSPPASIQSQRLLSPMSAQNWIVQDYSPWADEGMVNIPDTPPAETHAKTTDLDGEVDRSAEDVGVAMTKEDPGENTPVAESLPIQPKTPTNPPQALPQTPSGLPAFPPKIPSPRTSPKASLPTLKLQTSFPNTFRSTSQRKKTPIPQRQPSRKGTSFDLLPPALPVSATEKDIRIEIMIPDSDDEEEANLTDFEDADLTARSPVKTPGGSMWLNIDDILSTYEKPWGAAHHRRKSSSLHEMQTPAGERLGPMTPNGYDDISPITRGEWGFLMISDQFRTKTAAISCV